jgi:hypothetical protein|tara:strand:- start:287 stop:439 length:153 start_codon:yes stop_codon:yes gene_type:complete
MEELKEYHEPISEGDVVPFIASIWYEHLPEGESIWYEHLPEGEDDDKRML